MIYIYTTPAQGYRSSKFPLLPAPALENERDFLLASTGLGKQNDSPLPSPAKGKQNKILLAFTGQGKTEQDFLLASTGQGKTEQNSCSRVSSELSCPDRVSTSSHPPAKSGPKFACTSVASSPGSEQCANFPPSTLQRLLQGSNEPPASAKVGKLKVPRVVPSVSLLPGDLWTVRTFRVIGEHQGFGPVVSGTALGCSPFAAKHCFAG